jgi:hypothetical protein
MGLARTGNWDLTTCTLTFISGQVWSKISWVVCTTRI